MTQKCDAKALGYAGAIVAALGMLVLSIVAKLGLYTQAAEQMMKWHMFYSLSIGGIVAGMIEGAVISFIVLWLFAYFYNKVQ